MPNPPKLVLPTEETKRLAALIQRELLQWPDVSVRPMFGMHAVYRGSAIFAALPGKRAMSSPRAIAYKMPPAKKTKQDKAWQVFEIEGAHEIGRALELLDQAYQAAARRRGQ
jgi:hypothetical protein